MMGIRPWKRERERESDGKSKCISCLRRKVLERKIEASPCNTTITRKKKTNPKTSPSNPTLKHLHLHLTLVSPIRVTITTIFIPKITAIFIATIGSFSASSESHDSPSNLLNFVR
ncbi:hypothetical protein NE237_030700 [Protea cynaroides]|uniref:Uncharacterized protein n=1 Tax=Protea cynaroides TaxID=273540 RepID=A0A9Q0JXJ5_9MAGN|nr:hypothetical protein NE237_030700 [Protea cynaroides]